MMRRVQGATALQHEYPQASRLLSQDGVRRARFGVVRKFLDESFPERGRYKRSADGEEAAIQRQRGEDPRFELFDMGSGSLTLSMNAAVTTSTTSPRGMASSPRQERLAGQAPAPEDGPLQPPPQ